MQKITNQIKKYAIGSWLLAFVLTTAEAAIIRIDNRPGRPTDFPDLATAISKAQTDDTIYLAGSNIDYANGGTITLNNRLRLIGPGYFRKDNYPENRTESFAANISELIISQDGAGSDVSGLFFSDTLTVDGDDCFIQRCFADRANMGKTRESLRSRIHQCYIKSLALRGRDLSISNTIIVWSIIDPNNTIWMRATATFSQNTMIIRNTARTLANQGTQIIMENNIIYFELSDQLENFQNQLNEGGTRLGDNNLVGHLNNQKLNADIASQVFLREGSTDARLQLALEAENPARGAGAFGEDLGAFGGATPYVLSGIPPVPYFEIFQAQSTVGPTGTLKVRLKALGGE